jgi:hypothetical protein
VGLALFWPEVFGAHVCRPGQPKRSSAALPDDPTLPHSHLPAPRQAVRNRNNVTSSLGAQRNNASQQRLQREQNSLQKQAFFCQADAEAAAAKARQSRMRIPTQTGQRFRLKLDTDSDPK